jgi:hypothetical protein
MYGVATKKYYLWLKSHWSSAGPKNALLGDILHSLLLASYQSLYYEMLLIKRPYLDRRRSGTRVSISGYWWLTATGSPLSHCTTSETITPTGIQLWSRASAGTENLFPRKVQKWTKLAATTEYYHRQATDWSSAGRKKRTTHSFLAPITWRLINPFAMRWFW